VSSCAAPGRRRPGRALRRAIGLAVVLLATLPIYRVLAHPETGRAGWVTIVHIEMLTGFALAGLAVVLAAALGAARFLPAGPVEERFRAAAVRLGRLPTPRFALCTALLGAVLTAIVSHVVLDGRPNNLDAIVQMLHARFVADGRLAGPVDGLNAFWHIQNSVITERGWVSQYPPGHVLLLAAGIALGAPWLVGPLLVGLLAGMTVLIGERALPRPRSAGRVAGLLVATSAFVLCIGASYLNHVPVVALMAVTTYGVLRARRGGAGWAVLAGAAAGLAFSMRPLAALVIAAGVAVAAWLEPRPDRRAAVVRVVRLGAASVAGALLPVAATLAYNRHFFGGALTFGYNAALGPRMGLGFGRDPWGNRYGPLEALGYTSSDLTALGVALLETPVSAVVVVGLLLFGARDLSRGERVLAAWALVPVLANAFYWHHGMHMGPRMLYEAAPAWILLLVAACVRAVRAAPARSVRLSKLSPRMGVLGAAVVSLVMGPVVLAPQRILAYAKGEVIARIEPPDVPAPAVVFVHDAWIARVAMQLAGMGMRLDSVETAIRQNPTCRLQELVDLRRSGDPVWHDLLADLDLEPRATDLPQVARVSTGNTIRVDPASTLSPACMRQIHADRNGIIDIAPLVWQGDLPGGSGRGALFVRDLGPEVNRDLLAAVPGRRPWVLFTPSDGAPPVLVPYADGMRTLWADAGDVPAPDHGGEGRAR
jgi:hypothetical protein